MRRRTLLAALLGAALLAPSARAEEKSVLKVEGTVTAKTFAGLDAFLSNSLDTVVGLKLRLEPAEGSSPGSLVVRREGDLLLAYLVGGESQISAREGVGFQNGAEVIDGFFVVKDAGFNQGIASLFLEKAEDAAVLLSGAPVTILDIERLDPAIRKQD
ncbi:hypothetical protein ASG43_13610 [Aureimonas sp. Leaf454]|uniref:hypothetical protein n=1 Tax=Aureimonas sp. Leaf454 TaxID=1736381 RepID=UPI0006F6D0C3|nr:hypothetical protein [Aureimonas sp. Leaf454]KQT44387.1 hypothetical protein ASG43_13610 [Aureimonas sp. Leaf454]